MNHALLKAASQAAVHRVADRLEPRIRQQFLDAVDQLRDRIDIDALAPGPGLQELLTKVRADDPFIGSVLLQSRPGADSLPETSAAAAARCM